MKLTWLSRAALAALLLFLLIPAHGAGGKKKQDDDIERITDKGRIDWTSGAIYATGLGAVPHDEPNDAIAYLRAREYANLDAMKNLLMSIEHVHIDAHTTGADFVTTSAVIRAEVEGLLKGPQIVGERKIRVGRDTMVEVTVCTHMYGDRSVASVFIPEEIRRHPETQEENPPAEERVRPAPEPERVQPEIAPAPIEGERYTSVIIDTRGHRVCRDMSPKIRRLDGSEVWGTINVDPDFVIEHGIVVYAHSIAEARQLSRAGDHPLVLRAVADPADPVQADAILSDEDAGRLLQLNSRDGFLDHLNVIFVVDPLK